MSEQLLAAVVIPTYRRPDLIRRCLKAVRAQDLSPSSYEVIVADDEASETTRRLVEALAAERAGPEIRYVAVRGAHGPAAARNQGWRAAQAPVIAFTDDDCLPARDWLRRGLARLSGETAGAQGRIRVPIRPGPTDYELDASHLEDAEFATANAFFRRDALEEVGGFDERFTAAWREDSDLFFQLIELGRAVERADDALVVHPIRPASWGVSLKQQRKSLFNALLYKKHPRLYRERVQPSPPWRYYRIVVALGAAVGAAAVGRRGLAVGAVAAWALMTGDFMAARLRQTSRAPSHVAEMLVTSALIPPLSIFWRLRGAVKYRVPFL